MASCRGSFPGRPLIGGDQSVRQTFAGRSPGGTLGSGDHLGVHDDQVLAPIITRNLCGSGICRREAWANRLLTGAFEILNFSLVFLRGFAGGESSEVAP